VADLGFGGGGMVWGTRGGCGRGSGVPRGGGGGGGGRPGRRREGGAKMGIKAQGPGNDFFNRPTRAGWDHCQCHEVHVS
jgi:hypothetical protein